MGCCCRRTRLELEVLAHVRLRVGEGVVGGGEELAAAGNDDLRARRPLQRLELQVLLHEQDVALFRHALRVRGASNVDHLALRGGREESGSLERGAAGGGHVPAQDGRRGRRKQRARHHGREVCGLVDVTQRTSLFRVVRQTSEVQTCRHSQRVTVRLQPHPSHAATLAAPARPKNGRRPLARRGRRASRGRHNSPAGSMVTSPLFTLVRRDDGC